MSRSRPGHKKSGRHLPRFEPNLVPSNFPLKFLFVDPITIKKPGSCCLKRISSYSHDHFVRLNPSFTHNLSHFIPNSLAAHFLQQPVEPHISLPLPDHHLTARSTATTHNATHVHPCPCGVNICLGRAAPPRNLRL